MMLKREREWLENQKRATDNRVVVRLDSVSVEPSGDKGVYYVVIEGFNLHPRIAPPLVKVGGVTLEDLQYHDNGRRLTGILREKPNLGSVTIDYGYAAAELKPSSAY